MKGRGITIRAFIIISFLLVSVSCNQPVKSKLDMASEKPRTSFHNGYSEVNGLRMYYEVHGDGMPLVLIHGGGSTIETTFGRIIPALAKHRKVIAVELQAHGRTGDRNSGLSFEQDADDVAALLQNLHIDKADIFGFSNGGTTALQIAIRHPRTVRRLVLASALSKRSGMIPQFWGFIEKANIGNMPEQLKEAYLRVSNNPAGLKTMHDKDAGRMAAFKDIPDELVRGVKAPALIISGDKDVTTPEHALELHRLIAGSRLAIIPGGHGDYIGEITTIKPGDSSGVWCVPLIESFLE